MAPVAVLLAGPAVLSFFSGGYFDGPRLWAALGAWILVGIAAVTSPSPLPGATPGRLAVAGLALLTVWTAVSLGWAPVAANVVDDTQRLLLYLGALVAAAALLRPAGLLRVCEPALALGAIAAVGFGLSERLLPGVVELERSLSANGRLDQPLTYWNAMGALAAIGLVLCARMAGDGDNPRRLRTTAAALSPLLGLGLFLSVSRGAIAACFAGLAVLLYLAPHRLALRATIVCAASAVLASGASLALPAVRSLEGDASSAQLQGLVMLVVLTALGSIAAVALSRAQPADAEREAVGPGLRRALGVAAVVALVAGLAIAVTNSGEQRTIAGSSDTQAGTGRLTSIDSSRYGLWKVAASSFAENPVEGIGSGGFRVVWFAERTSRDPARDVHSLYLETAAELGLIGLAALALLLVGVALSARRALALHPGAAAGPVAALCTYAVHAGLDWDWEMPALTLVALVLVGGLIAASEQ